MCTSYVQLGYLSNWSTSNDQLRCCRSFSIQETGDVALCAFSFLLFTRITRLSSSRKPRQQTTAPQSSTHQGSRQNDCTLLHHQTPTCVSPSCFSPRWLYSSASVPHHWTNERGKSMSHAESLALHSTFFDLNTTPYTFAPATASFSGFQQHATFLEYPSARTEA